MAGLTSFAVEGGVIDVNAAFKWPFGIVGSNDPLRAFSESRKPKGFKDVLGEVRSGSRSGVQGMVPFADFDTRY